MNWIKIKVWLRDRYLRTVATLRTKSEDLRRRILSRIKRKSDDTDPAIEKPGLAMRLKPMGEWIRSKVKTAVESGLAKKASNISVDDIAKYAQAWKIGLALSMSAALAHVLSLITGAMLMDNRAVTPPNFVRVLPPPPPRKELTSFKDIYEKPIFDHESFVPLYAGGTDELDCNQATPTRAPLDLVGTIVLDRDDLSVVSLRDRGTSKVEAYQKDDPVEGQGMKVYKIQVNRVCFLNTAGKLEFIEIKDQGGLKISTGTAKAGPSQGVQQEDDTNYSISAKWKDEQINNIGEIVTQARAIPHFENGQIAGFRIINIKRGGIFDQLGIKEGDIVEEVNDIPLSNQGQALGLFNQLKDMNDGSITIVINRNGQQMVKNYNLKQ